MPGVRNQFITSFMPRTTSRATCLPLTSLCSLSAAGKSALSVAYHHQSRFEYVDTRDHSAPNTPLFCHILFRTLPSSYSTASSSSRTLGAAKLTATVSALSFSPSISAFLAAAMRLRFFWRWLMTTIVLSMISGLDFVSSLRCWNARNLGGCSVDGDVGG